MPILPLSSMWVNQLPPDAHLFAVRIFTAKPLSLHCFRRRVCHKILPSLKISPKFHPYIPIIHKLKIKPKDAHQLLAWFPFVCPQQETGPFSAPRANPAQHSSHLLLLATLCLRLCYRWTLHMPHHHSTTTLSVFPALKWDWSSSTFLQPDRKCCKEGRTLWGLSLVSPQELLPQVKWIIHCRCVEFMKEQVREIKRYTHARAHTHVHTRSSCGELPSTGELAF